jgi:hypothetical protein
VPHDAEHAGFVVDHEEHRRLTDHVRILRAAARETPTTVRTRSRRQNRHHPTELDRSSRGMGMPIPCM